jgi:hypothetical protein
VTYVALAIVLLGTLQLSVVVVLLAHLRGTTRSNDRRVDKLLDRNDALQDRLAHAEGRPWVKPPREEDEIVHVDPMLELVEPGEEWAP